MCLGFKRIIADGRHTDGIGKKIGLTFNSKTYFFIQNSSTWTYLFRV
ncbi:MAG: hypothetical protein ACI9LN_001443 [Saprospiraceae bacterium]|jgi:hypothetical protein